MPSNCRSSWRQPPTADFDDNKADLAGVHRRGAFEACSTLLEGQRELLTLCETCRPGFRSSTNFQTTFLTALVSHADPNLLSCCSSRSLRCPGH